MLSAHYSCPLLIKFYVPRNVLEKHSNIQFHENPSIRRLVLLCEQMDMRKLIVASCNFSNAPKNDSNLCN
jgi:hypothetical protein